MTRDIAKPVPLLVIVLTMCVVVVVKSGPVIDTKCGPVEGTSTTFPGLNVDMFKGIPYAESPAGDLRFLPPVPKKPWAPAVYDATDFGPSCPQDLINNPLPNYDKDEDCLLLNIYVPNNASDIAKPFAVMVWIHGGSFTFGQGMFRDVTALAAYYDVIAVTLNYRVGALGFLSTGDAYASGNYGLLDQLLALTWVKENVVFFGGNPEQVTIFGNSAGGRAIHSLALSPASERLFQRVISQSGTINYDQIIGDPATNARKLASDLGCQDINNHEKLVNCLRGIPADDIVVAQRDVNVGLVVDGEVITHSFEEFVAKSDFQKYDYLLGANSYEAIFRMESIPYDLTLGMPQDFFENQIRTDIASSFEQNEEAITDAALHEYTDWADPFDEFIRRDLYADFYGDHIYLYPTVQAAREHSHSKLSYEGGKTYHYHFDHHSSYCDCAPYVDGAGHSYEIDFVLGTIVLQDYDGSLKFVNVTAEEIELSNVMMEYWINFAKTG
ncbi:neuroligin-1-like [Glandiceps talaboti]